MASEQITGLVIGDSVIEWATVQNAKGRIEKTGSGEIALGEGEPDSNGVVDAGKLITQRLVEQGRNLKGDIVVCLSADKVLLRVVDLPAVGEDEIASMVELQAEKFSPFPVDSAVISHEVLSGDDCQCKVLIAVVKSDVLDVMGVQLAPVVARVESVDVDILAWLRLLRDGGHIVDVGRRILLVKSGSLYTVVVVQDGLPLVFRGFDEPIDLPEQEAFDEVAGEVAYTLMSMELGHGGESGAVLEIFSRDEVSSLLIEALVQECGCEVKVSPFEPLSFLAEGIARRKADVALRALDLMPESWRRAKQAKKGRKKAMMASGLLFGLWGMLALGFFGFLWMQQMRVSRLEGERDQWMGPANDVREMARRIHVVEQYMDRSDSALECLREITEFLPPSGITLDSFTYRKGEVLKLSGVADSRDFILMFQDNMNKTKIFNEVIPGEIKVVKGKNTFSFDLTLPGGVE